MIEEERERRKQETHIDFSFKIGHDESIPNESDDNGTQIDEEPYLSIIVDNSNTGLKRACAIFDQYKIICAFRSMFSSNINENEYFL